VPPTTETRTRALARGISIALHPIFVWLIAIAASVRGLPVASATGAVMLVALVVLVPLALFMIGQVRTGRWENVDASQPRERPRFFVFGLCAMAVLAAIVFRSPRFAFLARGVYAVAAIFVVSWALLRWVKISQHVALATLAAVLLLRTALPIGIALTALLPALAWARVKMKRHSLVEIMVGALLGAGTGVAMLFL
jgi:membrane-associated phospholipid phosphatase